MAQDQKSSNTMGDVINNQGIVTQGQVGNNTIINTAQREPDGVYQGTIKVGRADPPQIQNGVAHFRAMAFSAFPDKSKPLEYGNLVLSSEDAPVRNPNIFAGTISIMIAGFSARILETK